MIALEVWSHGLNDWHAQLRDQETGQKMGHEWQGYHRGALIGAALSELPLTHVIIRDVAAPNA